MQHFLINLLISGNIEICFLVMFFDLQKFIFPSKILKLHLPRFITSSIILHKCIPDLFWDCSNINFVKVGIIYTLMNEEYIFAIVPLVLLECIFLPLIAPWLMLNSNCWWPLTQLENQTMLPFLHSVSRNFWYQALIIRRGNFHWNLSLFNLTLLRLKPRIYLYQIV